MTTLKYYKIYDDVDAPFYGSNQAACFDICAYLKTGTQVKLWSDSAKKEIVRVIKDDRLVIYPTERVLVPTGLIFDIPKGYSLRLHPRSGQALKQGLTLANSEGVIDSDYVLETFCLMTNVSESNAVINTGDRICQAELVENLKYSLEETGSAPEPKTDRSGGFGSTGV